MPENVTNLTGEKPDTYDPNLHANEAMDAAIAELERLDGNGHVVAQLLEAREAIRANYRQRKGEGGDQDQAHIHRGDLRGLLGFPDGELASFVAEGGERNRCGAIDEALRNAHAFSDLMSALDDQGNEGAAKPRCLVQLSWMVQAQVERAMALRDIGSASG